MEQLLHISHIYITVWTQQVCLPCNPEMLVGYLCQPGLPYLLSPWESYTFMAHLSSLHWSLRTLMMTSSSSHNHLSSPLWRFCPFVIFCRLLQKSSSMSSVSSGNTCASICTCHINVSHRVWINCCASLKWPLMELQFFISSVLAALLTPRVCSLINMSFRCLSQVLYCLIWHLQYLWCTVYYWELKPVPNSWHLEVKWE